MLLRGKYGSTIRFIFVGIALFLVVLLYSVTTSGRQMRTKSDNVSNSSPSTGDDLVYKLEKELPEVDFNFWYRYAKPRRYGLNNSCANYPDPLDLHLHNTYWQTFVNANVTFRLFAAYLDDRQAQQNSLRGVVRVLSTANQIGDEFPTTYCQLWYAGHKQPIVVSVGEYLSVWKIEWGRYPLLNYPHLLSCRIPDHIPKELLNSTPLTVSLVAQECDTARNSLRIHYNQATGTSTSRPMSTHRIGVCLKAFDFPFVDISSRLIEWFELQRLLGASRIHAYMYDVHPAVQRTLDYYQRSGFLELRQLTMANGAPRLRYFHHLLIQGKLMVKRLNELIPYNDCFYRNMYHYDYVLNVDIDEVIVPGGKLRSWQQVLTAIDQTMSSSCPNGINSICHINSHFTNNPEPHAKDELLVLQHTLRQRNYTKINVATKCFHNTRYSLTLHNHYTLSNLPGGCWNHFLGPKFMLLHHYRDKNRDIPQYDLVEDRGIWKYEKELRAAVKRIKSELTKS